MRKFVRLPALVASGVAVAMLAACAADYPAYSSYPATPYPAVASAGAEYGQITGIEYMPVGTMSQPGPNILGAVVGGLAGVAVGSAIGAGAGRTAAQVLGGVAGAAIGNQIQRNSQGYTTAPGYRITMQTEQGGMRTFEVPATGDLHVGDHVRVDNGVIYRA